MVERRKNNPDMLYRSCVAVAQSKVWEEDLALTSEEFEKLMNSVEVKSEAIRRLDEWDLTERIQKEKSLPFEAAKSFARTEAQLIANELLPNLEEWLNGEPLSNIEINGKTVNSILKDVSHIENVCVIDIIHCLSIWKLNGFSPENFYQIYFDLK